VYVAECGALARHQHLLSQRDALSRMVKLAAAKPNLQLNAHYASRPSSKGLTFEQHSSMHNRQPNQRPQVTMPLPGNGGTVVLDDAALGRTVGTGSLDHSIPADPSSHRIAIVTEIKAARPQDARRPLAAGEQSWQHGFADRQHLAPATQQELGPLKKELEQAMEQGVMHKVGLGLREVVLGDWEAVVNIGGVATVHVQV